MSNLRYSIITRRAGVAFLRGTWTAGKAKHVQRATGDTSNTQHGAACGAEQYAEPKQSMGGKLICWGIFFVGKGTSLAVLNIARFICSMLN